MLALLAANSTARKVSYSLRAVSWAALRAQASRPNSFQSYPRGWFRFLRVASQLNFRRTRFVIFAFQVISELRASRHWRPRTGSLA
jgi:hypothetical protein